jgi:dihydrofolate reductase
MSKIVVFNHVTLDGVMQAPGRADEDLRGDFPYGGWAAAASDGILGQVAGENMMSSGGLLLGRRTYLQFHSSWGQRTDPNPFTDVLNKAQKFVASTTLHEPMPWMNSTLLQGDLADAVRRLKEEPRKDLVVMGSGELLRTLMQHNLVDRYVLMIHPLILGSGRRLFPDGATYSRLRLVDSKTTTTGVMIGTYEA